MEIFSNKLINFTNLKFEWSDFIINGVFKNIENVTIDLNETILVDDWDYLTKAAKFFKDISLTKTRFDFRNYK